MWSHIRRNLGEGVNKKVISVRTRNGIQTPCIEFRNHYHIDKIIKLLFETKDKIPRIAKKRNGWYELMLNLKENR
jgi:hypothetical protein